MNEREDRLAALGEEAERLSRRLAEISPQREQLIRELNAEGYKAAALGRMARLTRGRVWQIVNNRR